MTTPLRQDIEKLAAEHPHLRPLISGEFWVPPYRRVVERLAHAKLTLDAAVRIARKSGASFWLDVGTVRNISVKEYEDPNLGDTSRSGQFYLAGTLHVQPTGAPWSAPFPVSHTMQLEENPHSGSLDIALAARGGQGDAVGQLISMAVMDADVERAILAALGKLDFVPHKTNKPSEPAKNDKWAWKKLEEALRRQKLPTRDGSRRVSPGEFMLAAPEPFAVRSISTRKKFWQFKHGDSRQYVFIDSESGDMVVPKTNRPFLEGRFDKNSSDKQAAMLSADEFDSLRPRQRIWLGVTTAWMDMKTGETEFEVGRKTYSKKYDVYSISLYPIVGGKPNKSGAAWTLFKRKGNSVSLGHGGMGTVVKSYRLASYVARFTPTKVASLRAQPIEQVVTKYKVEHMVFGTWDLWYSDDAKDWFLHADKPSKTTGVPAGKVFSGLKLWPRPVKPGTGFEKRLFQKAEEAMVDAVSKYDMNKDPHLHPSLRRQASAVIVGDIFVSLWGYDQTNVDFYQVIGTTKTMVKLRQIAKRLVRGRGEPTEYVLPVANSFKGPPIIKKLKTGWDGTPRVDLTSYSGASKWSGKEVGQTGGAYGH